MALPVITTDDFKGYYKITLNEFTTEKLQEYISTFLEEYTRRLIGDAAYTEMAAEDTQKWLDMSNGVDFIDEDGNVKHLLGIKKPIVGFIYFEYVRDNFLSVVPGKAKTKSENSERAGDIEVAGIAQSRYNRLVCDLNKSMKLFLEVNETLDSVVVIAYDLGDNRYVLSIADPKYLNTGTEITLDNLIYEASEIISFSIDAGATGLDFTGDTAIWNFSELVISSDNTSGNLYQVVVGSTEGLAVGDTVTINAVNYTVLEVIPNTCFTIDAGAPSLDFTGQTATWTFSSLITVSVDLNDNSYLLTVENSTYVAVGADVDINAITYSIASLANNHLIDAGATGLDFTGESVEWKPFESVDFEEQDVSGI